MCWEPWTFLVKVFGGPRVDVGGQQEHYMYFRESGPDRPVRTPVHIVLGMVSLLGRNVEKQERQWRCNITLQLLRSTPFAVENPVSITYSESVYSLIYLYYVVICALFGCVIFFKSSQKGHDFRNLVITKYVFLFSLQVLSETFLI